MFFCLKVSLLSKHPKKNDGFLFWGGSWLEKVTTASGSNLVYKNSGAAPPTLGKLSEAPKIFWPNPSSKASSGQNFFKEKSHGPLWSVENSTKTTPFCVCFFVGLSEAAKKYVYKKYIDGHTSLRKIGPPATSLLNSQVLFSQGLDLIFTQLRPGKRGPRFLRWLPPATSLGGSSTRGKFTCLQRHPVTLIGGKSWKCFAFWVNLDRWSHPFLFGCW